MLENPLVSVVVSNYNYGHFLDQCIQSVLEQTYSHWELIIVDDHSTDDSREIIRGYQTRYPDRAIRLIHLEDGPAGDARAINRGIHEMNGELFFWLSSDDAFLPDRLLRITEIMKQDVEAGVVCCAAERINGLNEAGGQNWFFSPESRVDLLVGLIRFNLINGNTVAIRKSVIDQAGLMIETDPEYPDIWRAGDYYWWLRLAAQHPFRWCPEPLHRARIHEGNSPFAASRLGEELQGLHLAVFSDEFPPRRLMEIFGSDPQSYLRIEAELWMMLYRKGYPEKVETRQTVLRQEKMQIVPEIAGIMRNLTRAAYHGKCADFYWKMDQLDKTLDAARLSWENDPAVWNIRMRYIQGSCLKRMNRFQDAEDHFRYVIRHDPVRYGPHRSGAWFHLAEMQERSSETSIAVSSYRECLAENPDHRTARNRLKELGH